jgi:hypothetical protein
MGNHPGIVPAEIFFSECLRKEIALREAIFLNENAYFSFPICLLTRRICLHLLQSYTSMSFSLYAFISLYSFFYVAVTNTMKSVSLILLLVCVLMGKSVVSF